MDTLNNTTQTYIATEGKEVGQPIHFEITRYDIQVKDRFIRVEYLKHVMNKDNTDLLYSEQKSYIVKDIPQILDENGVETQAENLEFTNWRNQLLQALVDLGVSNVEEMFFLNTLPKILRINGLENETPMQ